MRTLWPAIDKIKRIDAHQRERLAIALSKPVGILGGNPGAGKTFTLAMLTDALIDQYGPQDVRICAPTGKAGVRLTENLYEYDIRGVEATTTHRMLGVSRNGHDGDGWGFIHNSENPVPARFILADESSMYGTTLGANLAAALQPGTHLLFSGDFGQLPPVEHGAPLRDLIAAGIPYGELEKIRRNAGDVITACRELKAGRMYLPSKTIDLEKGLNLPHFELKYGESAIERICRIVGVVKSRFGFDPVWDTQVICAVNEDTPVCRDELNKQLQVVLNPDGITPEGTKKKFRLGDKVINNSNMFIKKVFCPNFRFCSNPRVEPMVEGKRYVCPACGYDFSAKDMVEDFVANGEIGKLVSMRPGVLHVEFSSPNRTLRFAGEHVNELDLAYAITCHKSQGSQWPMVIVAIDDSRNADFVTSWEWYRTALSRMQSLCCTVGRWEALVRQCKRSALTPRKTFLKERIADLLKSGTDQKVFTT